MENMLPHIEREVRAKYAHLMIKWYEAVDWSEPLVIGAIAFHLVLFLLVFFTRKHLPIQFVLFLLIVFLLFITERVNSWARENWKLFATQQYFDGRGVFIGIFYAAPLMAAGFFQLVRTPEVVWFSSR